jgi:hypothetical protein
MLTSPFLDYLQEIVAAAKHQLYLTLLFSYSPPSLLTARQNRTSPIIRVLCTTPPKPFPLRVRWSMISLTKTVW